MIFSKILFWKNKEYWASFNDCRKNHLNKSVSVESEIQRVHVFNLKIDIAIVLPFVYGKLILNVQFMRYDSYELLRDSWLPSNHATMIPVNNFRSSSDAQHRTDFVEFSITNNIVTFFRPYCTRITGSHVFDFRVSHAYGYFRNSVVRAARQSYRAMHDRIICAENTFFPLPKGLQSREIKMRQTVLQVLATKKLLSFKTRQQ